MLVNEVAKSRETRLRQMREEGQRGQVPWIEPGLTRLSMSFRMWLPPVAAEPNEQA